MLSRKLKSSLAAIALTGSFAATNVNNNAAENTQDDDLSTVALNEDNMNSINENDLQGDFKIISSSDVQTVDGTSIQHDVEKLEDATKETTPVVEDTTPVVEEIAPVVEDTTPTVEDTTPTVEDTTPVVEEDTTPVVEDTTPVVEDSTPVAEDEADTKEEDDTTPVAEQDNTQDVVETPVAESKPAAPTSPITDEDTSEDKITVEAVDTDNDGINDDEDKYPTLPDADFDGVIDGKDKYINWQDKNNNGINDNEEEAKENNDVKQENNDVKQENNDVKQENTDVNDDAKDDIQPEIIDTDGDGINDDEDKYPTMPDADFDGVIDGEDDIINWQDKNNNGINDDEETTIDNSGDTTDNVNDNTDSTDDNTTNVDNNTDTSDNTNVTDQLDYTMPIDHATITNDYMGYDAIGTGHHGIDFAAAYGTAVNSVADGVVTGTGYTNEGGNYVTIVHQDAQGNYYTTYYGHLSAIYVNVGQEVNMGTDIGAVGTTGITTGPHTHFELSLGQIHTQNKVNPRDYMNIPTVGSSY